MKGQRLRSQKLPSDPMLQLIELELGDLAAGNYLLQLQHEGKALSRRIVKLWV